MNTAQKCVAAVLFLSGVIHLLPISGVLGIERLQSLYGVSIASEDLALLMRHRAVLFRLLGVFLMFVAFKPPLQLYGILAGLCSVVSFLILAQIHPSENPEIATVVTVDLVIAALLIVALIIHLLTD